MTDGTVKVTAEAHVHITHLNSMLQGPLSDILNQITSHGLALTDPNVWAGPAASTFASTVWPEVQGSLDQLRGSLTQLQQQVASVLNNVTQAGAGLPLGGLPVGGLPIGGLPIGGI